MAVLVVAEHDNAALRPATLNAVAAAQKLGGDVHLLVAGAGCDGAAASAAKVAGVAKVLKADAPHLGHGLAENLAPLLAKLAPDYSHVLAAATTLGKNVMPRAAALIDSQQVSDVIAVESPDTFVRPIYAGNALATVQSADKVKVLTIRITAFAPTAAEGGAAAVESVADAGDAGLSQFVRQDVQKTERPELTAAVEKK